MIVLETYDYRKVKNKDGFNFSRVEIIDLLKAWIVISIAFAIARGFSLGNLLMSASIVGSGFLVHELSHKFFAQQYGCWSEFRSDDRMLLIALMFSFLGFVFAAPGAVLISGRLSKRQNGIVSLAGPLSNLVMALLFLPFFEFGFMINSYLAIFNMLPFYPFDGSKVFAWNKAVFAVTFVIAGAFLLLH